MGEDVGSAVDFTYQPPSRFTGTIAKATIDLKGGATAAAPGAAMMGCRERLRGKRQLWGQGWRSRTVARAPSPGPSRQLPANSTSFAGILPANGHLETNIALVRPKLAWLLGLNCVVVATGTSNLFRAIDNSKPVRH